MAYKWSTSAWPDRGRTCVSALVVVDEESVRDLFRVRWVGFFALAIDRYGYGGFRAAFYARFAVKPVSRRTCVSVVTAHAASQCGGMPRKTPQARGFPMSGSPTTFKFSLLALLIAVTLVAAAVATLRAATPGVWGANALAFAAAYAGATIAALYHPRAPGRAFAGGLLVAGLAYLVFVRFLINDVEPVLPTSRILDAGYLLVVHEVPNPDNVPGRAMPMIRHPEIVSFRSIGHCCWSLLFGTIGGCVASGFARRGNDRRTVPPESVR